jgi:DNA repair exonuclease SbcCD ATPase subunit
MGSFLALQNSLLTLNRQVLIMQGEEALLLKQKKSHELALNDNKSQLEMLEQVQILLSRTSEYAREQLKTHIEDTVTAALRAVFEDQNLTFRIEIALGASASAQWLIVSTHDGVEVAGDPQDSRGGGVVDVVSLALRLSLLELARPRHEGPVVLDEPGKMISKEYLPNVAAFLKRYAEQTGRQIIIVTHHEALADQADLAYQVTKKSGVSRVEKIFERKGSAGLQ